MGLPDLFGLCTWFTPCSRLSLTSELKANVCSESLSLVLNPDSHAFSGFHFIVCVSREHMSLSASGDHVQALDRGGHSLWQSEHMGQ